MKTIATSITLLISILLVSGCGNSSNNSSAERVIIEYDKIKSVVGLTRTQVKEILGAPADADDAKLVYYTIQPDTGKTISCYVWFQNDPTAYRVQC